MALVKAVNSQKYQIKQTLQ